MAKSWADEEHVGKLTVAVMNVLNKKFHVESKKTDEKIDLDKLIKFSQAIGYQAQIFSGLQKNHEFAKRLKSVEEKIQNVNTDDPYSNNPVLPAEAELKVKTDGR